MCPRRDQPLPPIPNLVHRETPKKSTPPQAGGEAPPAAPVGREQNPLRSSTAVKSSL
jgi:hypothetical protein